MKRVVVFSENGVCLADSSRTPFDLDGAMRRGAAIASMIEQPFGTMLFLSVPDGTNDPVHPAAEVDLPSESDPTGGLGATVCSDDLP